MRTFALRYWLGGLAERGGAARRAAARGVGGRGPATRRSRCRSATSACCSRTRSRSRGPSEPLVRDARRPDDRARGAAGLQGGRDDRAGGAARCRSRRPTARCWWTTRARTRRPRWRSATGSTCCAIPAQPRLRREPEDVLRPRHPRRRRRRGDGPRRQPVRPGAGRARWSSRSRRGIADVVIGSRLLEDEAIAGGMPRWKWVGNRFLTAIENARLPPRLLRVPHGLPRLLDGVPALDPVPAQHRRVRLRPGDLRPDGGARGARVVELPIPTRYFLEASSVSFRASVEYGLRTLGVLARYRLRRAARPLAAPAPARPRASRRESRPGRHGVTPRGRLAGRRAGSPRTRPLQLAGKAAVMADRAGLGGGHHALPRGERLRQVRARARVRADVRRCSPTWACSRSACARCRAARRSGRTQLVGTVLALRLALSLAVVPLAALVSLALPYDREVRVAILIAGGSLVLGLVNGAIVAVFQARLRMGTRRGLGRGGPRVARSRPSRWWRRSTSASTRWWPRRPWAPP